MSRFEPARAVPRVAALLAIGLGLAACGFRLAGSATLPAELERMYLLTQGFSTSQRAMLETRLERAGATIFAEPGADTVRLDVSLKALPDRRVAASASTGKIVQLISRRLYFTLSAADGKVLLAPRALQQEREFELDEDNLLASSREREGVVADLERALFDTLVRQLERS